MAMFVRGDFDLRSLLIAVCRSNGGRLEIPEEFLRCEGWELAKEYDQRSCTLHYRAIPPGGLPKEPLEMEIVSVVDVTDALSAPDKSPLALTHEPG